MFPGAVDMNNPDVQVKGITLMGNFPACRTAACHAGHYLIGLMGKAASGWDFSYGARKMAEDLGFRDSAALERWAGLNPDIWGCPHGKCMFVSVKAFGLSAPDEITVPHIADWWERVGDRLEALEIAGSGE